MGRRESKGSGLHSNPIPAQLELIVLPPCCRSWLIFQIFEVPFISPKSLIVLLLVRPFTNCIPKRQGYGNNSYYDENLMSCNNYLTKV